MKRLLQIILILLPLSNVIAQNGWLETNPIMPEIDSEFTITFYPSKAAGASLANEKEIYIHSWAVTSAKGATTADYGGQASWGDNTKGALTKISDGKWQIKFTPRTFFGIKDTNEKLYRIGIVLRNADGSKTQRSDTGGDIYMDANPGLDITINKPAADELIIEKDKEFTIDFNISTASDIVVKINNVEIASANNKTEYKLQHTFTSAGKKTIEIKATSGLNTTIKKIEMNVYNPITEADIPSWINANAKGVVYHKDIAGQADDYTKATLILHTPTSVNFKDGAGKSLGSKEIPQKKIIYVIGDFNNWQASEEYKMNISPDKSYFWITLNNLEVGKEYIYQYYIDGKTYIADPYSDKISDADDKYISSVTYPNLKAYPEGKAHGRASFLQTQQSDYKWQNNDFKSVKHEDLNVYELHIRDFTEEGNFKSAEGKLDYLKKMGINCIHLMPVNEFEGNDSWGYNPNFYFAVDKAYGKKDDLKSFIDNAHKKGIAVINDLVLNHSFNSSSFAKMYWDDENNRPQEYNPWYNAEHNFKNPAAHWGSDFNHTSEYTQELVDDILNYWISEFHFDGFRFDFTKGFSNISYPADSWGGDYDAQRIGILKRMVAKMREKHPSSIAVLEHLASSSEDAELSNEGMLMWGGKGITGPYEQLAMGMQTDIDISGALYKNRSYRLPYFMSYMESHDEERLAYKALAFGKGINAGEIGKYKEATDAQLDKIIPRLKAAAAFNLLLPGPRMIWQFGELAYDYSIDYNGRTGKKPVRWDYLQNQKRSSLYKFYSDMLNLRNTYNLYEKVNAVNYSLKDNFKRIYLNCKDAENNDFKIIVIGNFGDKKTNVNPDFSANGKWYRYDSYEVLDLKDYKNVTLDLKAGEFRIYSSKAIWDAPQGKEALTIKVDDVEVIEGDKNPEFTVSIEGLINNQTISDLDGSIEYRVEGDQIIASGLSSDIYDITYLPGKLTTVKGEINLKIWPNPSSDEIKIKGYKEGTKGQIYDLRGRLIVSFVATERQMSIQISNLSDGIYILRIGTSSTKFIKRS
jgi:hypothetical protein